jgi:hypothetical protein
VRGYLPAPPEVKKNLMDLNVEQETLRELAARFQKNSIFFVTFIISRIIIILIVIF